MHKKNRKRFTVVYVVALILIFVIGIVVIVARSPFYNEREIHTWGKIAVIPLKGPISTENGAGDLFNRGTVGSGSVVSFIETAAKDKEIKGIILNINSPGGTVVASKEIADAVKKVDKPVVALIREVGASGAYWVASAADYIVADPLSVTGSIGVVGSYLEFSELFSQYGVTYQDVKTGEYKDLGNPYKTLTPQEKEVLVGKLQIIHDYFADEVSKNRGKNLNKYANGLFYMGTEAKEIGLVDELGGKEEAISAVKRLAGIDDYELVLYQKDLTFFDLLGKITENFGFRIGEGFGNTIISQNDDFQMALK